jgi:hypothetical protein
MACELSIPLKTSVPPLRKGEIIERFLRRKASKGSLMDFTARGPSRRVAAQLLKSVYRMLRRLCRKSEFTPVFFRSRLEVPPD